MMMAANDLTDDKGSYGFWTQLGMYKRTKKN